MLRFPSLHRSRPRYFVRVSFKHCSNMFHKVCGNFRHCCHTEHELSNKTAHRGEARRKIVLTFHVLQGMPASHVTGLECSPWTPRSRDSRVDTVSPSPSTNERASERGERSTSSEAGSRASERPRVQSFLLEEVEARRVRMAGAPSSEREG